jgi:hypothetical protein
MIVTVLELLREKLPEKYVLAIIANMTEKAILDEETDGSILDEIETIFDWQESNEGWLFWADVFESIAEGRGLPPMPLTVKWKPNSYVCSEAGSFIININETGKDVLIKEDLSKKSKEPSVNFLREQYFAFCN